MNRLTIFLDNLNFARSYTKSLLENLTDEQFFWSPNHESARGVSAHGVSARGVSAQGDSVKDAAESSSVFQTHIAWQVGHLAMAQYGLCLFRQRGRTTEDTKLMSGKVRKLFMKGTQPVANRELYPSREEIMAVLDRVHDQVLLEVPQFQDAELDTPIDPPTAAYDTRFGSLLMAVNHEMLHAGQIGLLRRMMGLPSLR